MAEIASDVRKATRVRAEAEHEKFKALEFEIEKQRINFKRERKEKISSYYFGLSTLFLTSTGIGGLSPILFNEQGKEVNTYTVIIGLILSLLFFILANKELKD